MQRGRAIGLGRIDVELLLKQGSDGGPVAVLCGSYQAKIGGIRRQSGKRQKRRGRYG
ncbi:hypothetical protein D3C83_178140 [compost metagenome]